MRFTYSLILEDRTESENNIIIYLTYSKKIDISNSNVLNVDQETT